MQLCETLTGLILNFSQMTLGYLVIEDVDILEIGEIISVSAILVAILLTILIFVWQMHSHSNRLTEEIRAQGTRLSEVEREQARLEGANAMLSNVLRQQSHTHETDD